MTRLCGLTAHWARGPNAKRRRLATPPPGSLLPGRSVRREGRGFLLHRRFGGDRGRGRLGLLLVPLDRLRLAREGLGQDLVHPRDRDDIEALLDALVDLDEILGV